MTAKPEDSIHYAPYDACTLGVFPAENPQKALLYLHGGGLEGGARDNTALFSALNKHGVSVISAAYRLYPEAKFPDFVHDAAAAVQWTLGHAEQYGAGGTETYILGSSAGAYLAMMLCFDTRFSKEAGFQPTNLSGFIFHSPQPTTHFRVLQERGVDRRAVRIDDASPLYHIAERPMPRQLLITYENDMPGRKEQNAMAHKVLDAYGIEHDFLVLPGGHCSGEYPDANGNIPLMPHILRFMEAE